MLQTLITQDGNDDRRRHPRYRQGLSLILQDLSWESGNQRTVVHDLSEGGFCIETATLFNPEDKLYFELQLPGLGAIPGAALCRWSRSLRYSPSHVCGAEIVWLEDADGDKLTRYLDSLLLKTVTPSQRECALIGHGR